MYYLLTQHHILPGIYYNLPDGDKAVIRAMFELDMENLAERTHFSQESKIAFLRSVFLLFYLGRKNLYKFVPFLLHVSQVLVFIINVNI